MEQETSVENNKKGEYSESILESLKPAVGEFFSGIGTLFFGTREVSEQKERSSIPKKNTTPIEELKPKIENPKGKEIKASKEIKDIYKEFPRKAGESAEAYRVRLKKIRQAGESDT